LYGSACIWPVKQKEAANKGKQPLNRNANIRESPFPPVILRGKWYKLQRKCKGVLGAGKFLGCKIRLKPYPQASTFYGCYLVT